MSDGLTLTFLGSGNAFTPGGRYWSGFVANGRYLFDAPPTLLPHLKRLNVPLEEIEAVFITHFHGDHFLGLPFLLLEYAHKTRRTGDFTIVGPPGVEAKIEALIEIAYPGLSSNDAGYHRLYVEAKAGEPQSAGNIIFNALPMNHARGKLECYGYRVEIGRRVVAYTGDTMYSPAIAQLAQGADVLVVDATYRKSGNQHMGLADVRRVRSEIGQDTAIIQTHLEGEPDLSPNEGLLVAHDFETFRF